jgi:endonuclease YncB( thermonuclease family)
MHEPDYHYAARLVNVVEGQDHLVAKTFKGETGKYGRYLARIWGEDKNLSPLSGPPQRVS